jgi:hypothetical protein
LSSCEQTAGPQEEEKDWWEDWKEPEEEETPPPVVVGLSVTKPEITLYGFNQEFEGWKGLAVFRDYSDGSRAQLAEGDYRLSPGILDTGNQGPVTVFVRAGELETEFDVYVSSSTSVLLDLSVKSGPSALYLGEPFNTSGMVIEGTYSDRTANVPLSAASVEGYDRYFRGDQTVTLRVNNKTAAFAVRPRLKPGSKFFVNSYSNGSAEHQNLEVQPAYIKGKEFDLAASNLKARFQVSWGSPFDKTFSAGNGIYPEDIKSFDKDRAGRQMLALDLDGVQENFLVYVVDVKPDVWFDYGFMRHAGDPGGPGPGSANTMWRPERRLCWPRRST